MKWLLSALCACVLFAGQARAQPSGADEVGGELIDSFLDLCLARFPDQAAFAAGARLRHLVPMPPEQVKRFLHEDPGRGWWGTTPSGRFVVTIENPPYFACAVRRLYKLTQAFQTTYQLAIGIWAANHKIALQAVPTMRREENGMSISATAQSEFGPDGKVRQTLMMFVTDYPSGRTEVRLVRQFPPK